MFVAQQEQLGVMAIKNLKIISIFTLLVYVNIQQAYIVSEFIATVLFAHNLLYIQTILIHILIMIVVSRIIGGIAAEAIYHHGSKSIILIGGVLPPP